MIKTDIIQVFLFFFFLKSQPRSTLGSSSYIFLHQEMNRYGGSIREFRFDRGRFKFDGDENKLWMMSFTYPYDQNHYIFCYHLWLANSTLQFLNLPTVLALSNQIDLKLCKQNYYFFFLTINYSTKNVMPACNS